MSLAFTKRHLQRLANVMDDDYESLEDAAKAVMAEAAAIYEERACWVVVGHMRWDRWRYEAGNIPKRGEDGAWIDEDDWRQSRIALGPFATEVQAEAARKALAVSTVTGEEFSTWVFPMWHDSPHAFFTKRKDDKKKLETITDMSQRAMRERALQRRIEWWEKHGSDSQLPDDIDDERERCGCCGQLIPDKEE